MSGRPQSFVDAVEPADPLAALLADRSVARGVVHVEHVAARPGRRVAWPAWVPGELVESLAAAGIGAPWAHQAAAANLLAERNHVAVSTGTASGKSLAYLLPAITALRSPGARVLYLAPTKALAVDQARAVAELGVPWLRPAVVDGDSSRAERDWVRRNANFVLTNPDLVHHSVLPDSRRWGALLRGLTHVVVDESHVYRGLFGSHVALVLRRLRRLASAYGSNPTFALTSATTGDAGASAQRLLGLPVVAVTDDASARASLDFVLCDSRVTAADVLAGLVTGGSRTLAFARSRRAVELLADQVRRRLVAAAPARAAAVAAYRAGYLAEERRALERDLRDGRSLALAATNALELGIDVAGLDAVVLCGYPGSRTALWQQVGRAGRRGRPALAVFVARAEPLDTYLVRHPDELLHLAVEPVALDPSNPHVLAPHLEAAAHESPLHGGDRTYFGDRFGAAVDDLVAGRRLRARGDAWYATARTRPVALRDAGRQIAIVDRTTGQLLGDVGEAAAPRVVHPGAVYLHQGVAHRVDTLDLDDGVALVEPAAVDFHTVAHVTSSVERLAHAEPSEVGQREPAAPVGHGAVEVRFTVDGYTRINRESGRPLSDHRIDPITTTLHTRAAWLQVDEALAIAAGIGRATIPAAAHALEHAATGLLPLLLSCDPGDVAGTTSQQHGAVHVFVYDTAPGGVGYADSAFDDRDRWLGMVVRLLAACDCVSGCPSCVQSPSCDLRNRQLDRAGALALARAVVRCVTPGPEGVAPDRTRAPARESRLRCGRRSDALHAVRDAVSEVTGDLPSVPDGVHHVGALVVRRGALVCSYPPLRPVRDVLVAAGDERTPAG